jgi:hypothetical protein
VVEGESQQEKEEGLTEEVQVVKGMRRKKRAAQMQKEKVAV